MPSSSPRLEDRLALRGISRREFLRFCSLVTATLALPHAFVPRVAAALEQAALRPAVVWLEFQGCTGDSEAFLRATKPSAADIILDSIALNYHETIMAAAGFQAEASRKATIEAGGHIVVVEGSIPTKEDGIYCCIAGHTAIDILQESTAKAAAVIAVGSCAAFGGLPKASPNPTGAVAVMDLVQNVPVINLSGCPMNQVNFVATVVHLLTFGQPPALDALYRPKFAHGQLIHDNCERRGHFNAGRFVQAWGDEGHRLGWCLYQMGCKGPVATFNCPTVRWNEGVNWPVAAGHGCIACGAPNFFEREAYTVVDIQEASPPDHFPSVEQPAPTISPEGAATLGAVGGLVVGAGAAAAVAVAHSRRRPGTEEAEVES